MDTLEFARSSRSLQKYLHRLDRFLLEVISGQALLVYVVLKRRKRVVQGGSTPPLINTSGTGSRSFAVLFGELCLAIMACGREAVLVFCIL